MTESRKPTIITTQAQNVSHETPYDKKHSDGVVKELYELLSGVSGDDKSFVMCNRRHVDEITKVPRWDYLSRMQTNIFESCGLQTLQEYTDKNGNASDLYQIVIYARTGESNHVGIARKFEVGISRSLTYKTQPTQPTQTIQQNGVNDNTLQLLLKQIDDNNKLLVQAVSNNNNKSDNLSIKDVLSLIKQPTITEQMQQFLLIQQMMEGFSNNKPSGREALFMGLAQHLPTLLSQNSKPVQTPPQIQTSENVSNDIEKLKSLPLEQHAQNIKDLILNDNFEQALEYINVIDNQQINDFILSDTALQKFVFYFNLNNEQQNKVSEFLKYATESD